MADVQVDSPCKVLDTRHAVAGKEGAKKQYPTKCTKIYRSTRLGNNIAASGESHVNAMQYLRNQMGQWWRGGEVTCRKALGHLMKFTVRSIPYRFGLAG